MRISAHGARVAVANIGGLTHIEPPKVDRVITNSLFEGNQGACPGNAGT